MNNPRSSPTPPASHAFLGTSHALEMIYLMDRDGKRQWEYPVTAPQDVWMLPDGHLLTTWRHGVREITPAKTVVWEYTVEEPNEVPTCQPLPDGNVMIGIVGECRRTPAGTYLVPFTAEGAVREYDRDGRCRRRPRTGGAMPAPDPRPETARRAGPPVSRLRMAAVRFIVSPALH
jgi:hypothetical protein